MKIRTVTLLAFSGLCLAGAFFLYRWTTDTIRPSYLKVVEENLVDTSRTLAALFSAQGTPEEAVARLRGYRELSASDTFAARIYDFEKTGSDLEFYLTDANGIVLYHSADPDAVGVDYSRWNDVHRTLQGTYGARSTRTDPNDAATSRLHVAAPLRANGGISGVLTVIKPITSPYRFMEEGRIHVLTGALLFAAGALLLVALLTHWLTRPLEALTAHAQEIAAGRRSSMPNPRFPTEVRRLARAFDDMRRAVDGKAYVEQYVATLTHEIKSPLAGIRAAAELLDEDLPPEQRERFVRNIQAETLRMNRVIDQLLHLSEIEGSDAIERRDNVNLGDLARELATEYGPLAMARGVTLETEGDRALIRGNRNLLRLAAGNLLQNAIEFSPRGAIVRLQASSGGGETELRVLDSGPGIPEFAREKVFDRFFSLPRPESGAKSSGLGLTMAREILRLHDGELVLDSRPEGGTVASMRFPA